MSDETKPAEWMCHCAVSIFNGSQENLLTCEEVAAIIARHAPTPAPSLEREAIEALQQLVNVARDSSWAHIEKAGDLESNPCTCKACSMKKARAVLAKAQP